MTNAAKVFVYDTRDLAQAGAEAVARAQAKAWDNDVFSDSTGTLAQDAAALWAIGQASVGQLSGKLVQYPAPGHDGPAAFILDGSGNDSGYPSGWHQVVGQKILRVFAWTAGLASPTPAPAGTVQIGQTKPGDVETQDAAAAAAPAVAWIIFSIGFAAVGAGVGYAVYTYAHSLPTILDRYLQKSEETKAQHAAMADLVALAGAHAAREKEAGKRLPFDAGEIAAIKSAEAIIDASIARQAAIVAAKPPVEGTADEPQSALSSLGSGLAEIGKGLFALGAVGGLVFGAVELERFFRSKSWRS